MSETEKPKFEEVYEFAQKKVAYFLRKFAFSMPQDQRDEVTQNAMLRVWESYSKLDADKGWKSFIQLHCKGAVLDYIKGGNGFIEDGKVSDPDNDGLKSRVQIISDDDSTLSVEDTAAIFGVFADHQKLENSINIKWDLLSRLAGKHEDIHIIAKVLLGYSQEQIAEQLSQTWEIPNSRERVSQRIYEFFESLDSIMNLNSIVTNQFIYALGLSSYYHMVEHDNKYGWDFVEFDLNDPDSFRKVKAHYQPSFFDLTKEESLI